ncbi:hypothetical protein Bbelb_391280 [Branchiostoma belcheri]|nr:hypothetical protein Bbelb_391280 [Branchiostoma belcheri]
MPPYSWTREWASIHGNSANPEAQHNAEDRPRRGNHTPTQELERGHSLNGFTIQALALMQKEFAKASTLSNATCITPGKEAINNSEFVRSSAYLTGVMLESRRDNPPLGCTCEHLSLLRNARSPFHSLDAATQVTTQTLPEVQSDPHVRQAPEKTAVINSIKGAAEVHRRLGWMDVKSILKHHKALLLHKALNNQLPPTVSCGADTGDRARLNPCCELWIKSFVSCSSRSRRSISSTLPKLLVREMHQLLTWENYYQHHDVARVPKALRLIDSQLKESGGILSLDSDNPDSVMISVFLMDYLVEKSQYEIVSLGKCF